MHGTGPVDKEVQTQEEASAPAADVDATVKGNVDDNNNIYNVDCRSRFALPCKPKCVYTSSSQEKKQKQLRKASHQLDNNDDAPRDDDGNERRQPANPVTPANPKSQCHPASTTAALVFRPRNLAFESAPEAPSPSTRPRGNCLRSVKCKNYAASNANIPQDAIIKLHSRTDPSYVDTEQIQPAGTVCEQIIDKTRGDDFTKTVTWHDGRKNINNGTQRAALVAQASTGLAPQPCVHCINNGGSFDRCKISHGKKHCSLADKNTPSKASKTIDIAFSRLEAEFNNNEATLHYLQEDLMSSRLINWDEVKENPQGVKHDCEKVLEYLDIEANIMVNLVALGDRLISVLKRRRFLRHALEKNLFATKPLTEDEESDDEFERGIQEMEHQQERKKYHKAQEYEIEDSLLKHKEHAITKPIDDQEDDECLM
ncbi:hypothetical protein KEM55_003237 [Ascosphaera atra]|nr:hypothetical protein KEM55_003237 [Ascosphaera atra]